MVTATRSLIGMLALSAVVLPLPVRAGDLSPVGVVTTLDGHATVTRAALPASAPLKLRDQVFVADRITTGDQSFARILLGGKAIVTVRERSVLAIREAPGAAIVDLASGKIALAVVKERMKPGDSVEIRTPNAVAGVRGTVVIAEVGQATSQLDTAAAALTSTITVLRGVVEFRQLDAVSHQPAGPIVRLGALQSVRVTGVAPARPVQQITPEAARRLSIDLRVRLRDASAATPGSLTADHLRAASSMATVVGPRVDGVMDGPRDRPATGGTAAGATGIGAPAAGGAGSASTPMPAPAPVMPAAVVPAAAPPTMSRPAPAPLPLSGPSLSTSLSTLSSPATETPATKIGVETNVQRGLGKRLGK